MKSPFKIFWIVLGFLCLGIWHHRHCASDSADSSILYGNPVLLCEKFGTAAHLVYWDPII